MPRRSKNEESNRIEAVIEQHVANRIRLRRGLLGMSQSDLAKSLGITFQQIQKYERATNRVTVAKLYRLTDILDVPLSFFFDDLNAPDVSVRTTPAQLGGGHDPHLSRRELDLLRAWRNAPTSVADAVSSLLRRVGGMDEDGTGMEDSGAEALSPEHVEPTPGQAVGVVPRARIRRPAAESIMEDDSDAAKGRRRRGAIWDPADIKPPSRR